MAKYVKISLLSQPPLPTPYSDDLESKVQEMLAYLKMNLEKVLPDKPDQAPDENPIGQNYTVDNTEEDGTE